MKQKAILTVDQKNHLINRVQVVSRMRARSGERPPGVAKAEKEVERLQKIIESWSEKENKRQAVILKDKSILVSKAYQEVHFPKSIESAITAVDLLEKAFSETCEVGDRRW
jgi:hypothetical protein